MYVQYGTCVFEKKCPICGRFVKADDTALTNECLTIQELPPNATCKKCGRVKMFYAGENLE